MLELITAIILHLVSTTPNSRLCRDAQYREEMAQIMIAAGQRYNQPPPLLTVWFFEESSLRVDVVGKKKELGISQIHPGNFPICARTGHNIKTTRGQIMCGAVIADMGRRKCNDLERGWYWYASGRSCKGTPRAIRITKRRIRRTARLVKKFTSNDNTSDEP